MRVLIVTGSKAYDSVKKAVGSGADVLALDVSIAAFITPKLLRPISNLDSYDIVLVPGLASGDFSNIEMELGVKIRLGPKHAYDLDIVLPCIDSIDLSHTIPACHLLSNKKHSEAMDIIHGLEKKADCSFGIKNLKIGGGSIMKVMGEIVDATRLDPDVLQEVGNDYILDGADIIDLGVPIDATPAEVRCAVKAASHLDVPTSIDTLDPDLILAGIEAGIDMVLSLNGDNMELVGNAITEQGLAAVIIGGGDLKSLQRNIELAQDIGIKKVIADPILNPIGHGLVDSLMLYREFRQFSDVPLFFGAGNVTELIDADSIGVNATMAGIAMELGASILFTPEYSDKAKGSISELKTAAEMMFLAEMRNTAPKDLGLDLLVIKEKRRRKDKIEVENPIEAKPHTECVQDPMGCFRIALHDGKIIAKHGETCIAGTSARAVFDTIHDIGLASAPEHAAYLARELMKAELALKFGRSYMQDDEF